MAEVYFMAEATLSQLPSYASYNKITTIKLQQLTTSYPLQDCCFGSGIFLGYMLKHYFSLLVTTATTTTTTTTITTSIAFTATIIIVRTDLSCSAFTKCLNFIIFC